MFATYFFDLGMELAGHYYSFSAVLFDDDFLMDMACL